MFEKLTFKNTQIQENNDEAYNLEKIPRHIAIIMDGNGRWAVEHGSPRISGHREGMNTVKKIVKAASRLGVEILTLYTFSTENWKRPKNEVDFLMKLPEQFLMIYLKEMIEENVQICVIGDESKLPQNTQNALNQAKFQTGDNDGMVLNFALNYGSRYEMTETIKQIVEEIQLGKLSLDAIDETVISDYLLTKSYPDPDLFIRTGGELRLSNFMLWQLAYTELWFTKVYWPDFTEKHLKEAITQYNLRTRRYGDVKGKE